MYLIYFCFLSKYFDANSLRLMEDHLASLTSVWSTTLRETEFSLTNFNEQIKQLNCDLQFNFLTFDSTKAKFKPRIKERIVPLRFTAKNVEITKRSKFYIALTFLWNELSTSLSF